MRFQLRIVALTLGIIGCGCFAVESTIASDLNEDGLRTNLTSKDVVEEMGLYRKPDRRIEVLEFWVKQLRKLQSEVAISTQMTAEEKHRKTRSIERRIEYLEDIAGRVERVEQERSPDAEQITQSPPQQENVPTGWRRWRSWQGGGALPGGGWQGSEYQEVWGNTIQSSSSNDQGNSTSGMSNGNGQQVNFPEGFGQWPSGNFPTNSQPQMGRTGGMTRTGGGIMTGGRSGASSSRSSSSRSMRQSGGR